VLAVLGVGALGVVSGACTKFAGDEPAAPGADGGTDGPSPDGGTCGFDFCEDFEGKWTTRWQAAGTELSEATEGESTSPTKALDVVRAPLSSPHLISRELGGGRVFTLSVQVRVVAMGDGEMDLVGILGSTKPAGPNVGLVLVRPRGRTNYVIEPEGAESKPIHAKFDSYARVTLVVDLDEREFRYDVDGQTGMIPIADPKWQPKVLHAVLGAFYEQTVTVPWHIRYDDVGITTLPRP
jgi:hypothetical protein